MSRISLSERISVWMEVEILSRLTPKNGVGPVFKWVFKIPVLYYKLGLGWMLEERQAALHPARIRPSSAGRLLPRFTWLGREYGLV
jgi:hypothetical protein